MKKIYTLALALLCGFSAFAQTEEAPITVVSGTTETNYDNLKTAIEALKENDVLVINKDLSYNSGASGARPTVSANNVTIKGKTSDVVLTLMNKNAVFIILGGTNVTISDITMDGYEKDARGGNGFEISNNKSAVFKNVKFQNYNFSGTDRTIIAPATSGRWTMENCSFENITNGKACASANANCSITGNIEGCSIYVNGNNSINAQGLTGTNVGLKVDDTRTMGNNLVTNCTDASLFKLLNEGMYLEAKDGNLQINKQSTDVVNSTTGVGYASLTQAIGAASENDVLVVNAAQTYGSSTRLTISGKKLTIKAGTDGTIKRGNNGLCVLINNESNINFDGITFDGDNISSTAFFIEVSKGESTSKYANATFKNCKFINTNAQNIQVVQVKNGGKVSIEGCSAEGNTTTGEFFIGTSGNTLIGDNNLGVYLEKNNTIAYAAAESEAANAKSRVAAISTESDNNWVVTLYFDTDRTNKTLVTGDVDASKFKSGVDNYNVTAGEGGLTFAIATGVEGIEADENAEVEYFNLQGVRVANPGNGVFIRRQGSKVSKVVL